MIGRSGVLGEQSSSDSVATNAAAGIRSVFVSYSQKDRERVTGLLGGLTRLGYGVWYDQKLSGGQEWWDTILGQIRNCDAVLLAVSLAELDSRACRDEFEYARQLNKAVVPVMIEPVPPERLPAELARLQHVDYTEPNQEQLINLLVALRQLPPPAPLPDPLPAPPPVPMSYMNQLVQDVDKSVLGLDDQYAIAGKIREALQDPDHRAGAVDLLRRLNARKDLYRGPAGEVEAMMKQLEPPPAAQPVPAAPIVPKAPAIEPLPVEGATVVDTRSVSRPAAVSKPAASKPAAVNKPAAVSKPPAASKPAVVSKPAASKPAAVNKPAAVSKPPAASRPAVVSWPAPVVKPPAPPVKPAPPINLMADMDWSASSRLRTPFTKSPLPTRVSPVRPAPVTKSWSVPLWMTGLAVVMVYADTLNLRLRAGLSGWGLLLPLTAVLLLLFVGTVRRWRWTHWLVVAAFLGGILRVAASVLQLTGSLPAVGPGWYIVGLAGVGVAQFLFGLAVIFYAIGSI